MQRKYIRILTLILLCLFALSACGEKDTPHTTDDITAVTVERMSASGSDRLAFDSAAQTILYEFSDTATLSAEEASYQVVRLNWAGGAWDELMAGLEAYEILGWEESYEDDTASDGVIWQVDITFSDDTHKTAAGQNAYPQQWDDFIQSLYTGLNLPV